MSWFKKLKESLKKTSIVDKISSVFQGNKLDYDKIDELEAILLQADMGVDFVSGIINTLRKTSFDTSKEPETLIKDFLILEITKVVEGFERDIKDLVKKTKEDNPGLMIINFIGVNGSGKTTSIGKIAHMLSQNSFKVALGACDTFRAAAVEQVSIWSNRAQVKVFSDDTTSDPGTAAYKAVRAAAKEGFDVLLIDTAGRLHNREELMNQLKKIGQSTQKSLEHNSPTGSIHNIIVLDATTGQNLLNQVENFGKCCNLSGFILTKLDGSAKGGVLLNIIHKYKLPVFAVGVGEKLDDIGNFNTSSYAKGIIG